MHWVKGAKNTNIISIVTIDKYGSLDTLLTLFQITKDGPIFGLKHLINKHNLHIRRITFLAPLTQRIGSHLPISFYLFANIIIYLKPNILSYIFIL